MSTNNKKLSFLSKKDLDSRISDIQKEKTKSTDYLNSLDEYYYSYNRSSDLDINIDSLHKYKSKLLEINKLLSKKITNVEDEIKPIYKAKEDAGKYIKFPGYLYTSDVVSNLGYVNFGGNTFKTLDDCITANKDYHDSNNNRVKIIGHRNENHPNANSRNSCFGYTKHPGKDVESVIFYENNKHNVKKLTEVDLNKDTDKIHHTACLNGANLNEYCDDGTSVISKIYAFFAIHPTLKYENTKVSLIEGKMNDTNITYLKYTYSDGTSIVTSGDGSADSAKKFGVQYIAPESSTDKEFSYVIKDHTFIVHIKEVLWEGGKLGSGLIITTVDENDNISNISIMPSKVDSNPNDAPIVREYKIYPSKTWHEHLENDGKDGYTFASIPTLEEAQNASYAMKAAGVNAVWIGAQRKWTMPDCTGQFPDYRGNSLLGPCSNVAKIQSYIWNPSHPFYRYYSQGVCPTTTNLPVHDTNPNKQPDNGAWCRAAYKNYWWAGFRCPSKMPVNPWVNFGEYAMSLYCPDTCPVSMRSYMKPYLCGPKWAGPDHGKDGDTWYFTDGKKFDGNAISSLFRYSEPNNWHTPATHNEDVLELIGGYGNESITNIRFNDNSSSRRRPGLFYKLKSSYGESDLYVNDRKHYQLLPGKTEESARKYSYDITSTIEEYIYILELLAYDNKLNLFKSDVDTIINYNINATKEIDNQIEYLTNEIQEIDNLNKKNSKESFINIDNKYIANIKHYMGNLFHQNHRHLAEGSREYFDNVTNTNYDSPFYDKAVSKDRKFQDVANEEVNSAKEEENGNDLLLYLEKQQNDLLNNVLNDYFYDNNNKDNRLVSDVYQKTRENNVLNERNIELNEYQKEKNMKYVELFKICIYVLIIVFIVLFLKILGIIPANGAIALVILIITLLVLYVSYTVYLITFKKDKKYFYKNVLKDQDKKFDPSDGIMTDMSLNIGDSNNLKNIEAGICYTDDCCSDGMTYDMSQNKCLVNESFGNINMIYPSCKEGFLENPSATKQHLIIGSLINSDPDKFNSLKNKYPSPRM